MRENRPDDHDVIVVEQLGIDLHRHVHLKQSAAEVADFVSGNGADVFERAGVVPRVIENCTAAYWPVRSSCVISSRCSIAASLMA